MFTTVHRSQTAQRCLSRQLAIALLGCIAVILSWPHEAAAADDEVQAIHGAIERSVPFIERKGAEWIASKDCLSCHHTSFMVWSLNAAKRAGVTVDEDNLKESTDWAIEWKHLVAGPSRDKADREETLHGQADTLAQLLLGGSAADSKTEQPQWFAAYATALVEGQQTDGSWTSGGQLPFQKRPKRETQEVSTMWASLAILAADVPDAVRSAALAKSVKWLGNEANGKSTEWWAARLLLERANGNADKADQVRAQLIHRQREDGGWGWLCDDDSDALGTGIALFALSGQEVDDEAADRDTVSKAIKFLLETQSKDGYWPVRGTKQNAKDRVQPTATYWGTCWAVIGLCESIR